jgi:membrane-bound metal-dependent hydrolase YbcI (DUF457 family)
MTGKSHLLAGTAVTAAALHQANFTPANSGFFWAVALGVGLIASLLPDVDARNPLIRRLVQGGGRPQLAQALISRRMRRRFPFTIIYLLLAAPELLLRYALAGLMGLIPNLVQHRGPTHYLLTAAGLTALFWTISHQLDISPRYALAFGAGYASHIWCDAMTRNGVRLFAPLSRRSYHALPYLFRLSTGRQQSLAELAALLFIGAGASLAFITPAAVYLPAVAVAIVGMFVITAVWQWLRARRARARRATR